MTNPLTELIKWFSLLCDGDWEHGEGITIESLDNPGWHIKICLEGTLLEEVPFDEIKRGDSEDFNDENWLECRRDDRFFIAMCGRGVLEEAIGIFVKWMNENTDTSPWDGEAAELREKCLAMKERFDKEEMRQIYNRTVWDLPNEHPEKKQLLKLVDEIWDSNIEPSEDDDGFICPICGKTVFKEICDCDICTHCGWENDYHLDYDYPSHLDLADYKKRYEKYLLLYPDYTWEKYGNPEITDEDECRLAHRYCAANEAYVHESDKCGCFFCLKTFRARDVVNWLDDSDGKTAVCPYCGVDSVLPDSKVELSKDFLEKMYEVWFGNMTDLRKG